MKFKNMHFFVENQQLNNMLNITFNFGLEGFQILILLILQKS